MWFGQLGTGFSEAVLEERSTSLRSRVIATPKVGLFFSSFWPFFGCNTMLELLLIVMIQISSNTTELETASIQTFGSSPLR